MKNELLSRLSLAVVPAVLGVIGKLWFATCKVTVHGGKFLQEAQDCEKPIIGTFWHYSLLGAFNQLRGERGVAMVSSSKDGEYIARLINRYGFTAVRGSTNKRGVQALKDLIRNVKAGENGIIVADGSQGPALKAQPGAILLASMTGAPILPMAWSADRYLTIRSWDRTAFPKPFSKVQFAYAELLYVPKGLKSEGLEEYRLMLDERLNGIYKEMWALQGKINH